jgi:hypothetical protein
MSRYNQEYNKDNSVIRYIIAATLAELKSKIYYYNQVDEDTTQKIEIPFFHSVTGSERLLSDVFVYDTAADGKAIGNYDVVPRGILQLESTSIDSSSQTNKFIPGEFVREYEGILKTFVLDTNFLPLNLEFSVTIICSSVIELFKVTESLVSKMYKGLIYSADLGMFRVQSLIELPEDYSQNRSFEFGLNDKKEFTVTFNISVKSFMPVFENGIILGELNDLIRKSLENNPNANGVGLFRSNEFGEGGIYFGGVLKDTQYTIRDENTGDNLLE